MIRRKRYYLAGPMSGIPQFNFPAFDTAKLSLLAEGYDVVSPAELDDETARAAALASPDGDLEAYKDATGETWGDFLARDVKLIADEVDGVILLEGWEESKGARLEAFVARTCGKPVYDYEVWFNDPDCIYLDANHRVPDDELVAAMSEHVFTATENQTFPIARPSGLLGFMESEARRKKVEGELSEAARQLIEAANIGRKIGRDFVLGSMHRTASPETDAPVAEGGTTVGTDEFEMSGEVRVTSETGGQKGRKPQRMDLLPPEALLALSEVYGMGAEKYDDHNYLKGYDWSLSFGALLRHVMAAEKGEWLDDESGLPHVMHAAWHCFSLFMFEKHGLGTDDRISSTVEGVSK